MSEEILFRPDEIAAATGGPVVSGVPGKGALGVSIDTRTIQPGQLFVAVRGRRFDGHDFVGQALERGAVGAVVDRWPLGSFKTDPDRTIWRVPDTLTALGELARFHRSRFPIDLVAVTGSTGKSTTKTMLAHILATRELLATPGTQNNLIGVPLTLFQLNRNHRIVVLELGTNQWGEIRRLTQIAQPSIGVITNIGPAHLETFGDLNGVLKAKGELWEAMDPKGRLVLNADDPLLLEAGKRLPFSVTWFGMGRQADVRADRIILESWSCRCLVNGRWELNLPLPGRHNLMNALAALTCAQLLGEPIPSAAERLSTIGPLPGRLTQSSWDGCFVIDDSYNANPSSLKAALEVLSRTDRPGRRIAVIGDMLELGDQAAALHEEAGQWILEAGVDLLITVGPLARHLLNGAWEAGLPKSSGWSFDAAEEAGQFLEDRVRPGDAILVKGSREMRMERVLRCFTTSSTH